jgi:hypothetical protein
MSSTVSSQKSGGGEDVVVKRCTNQSNNEHFIIELDLITNGENPTGNLR